MKEKDIFLHNINLHGTVEVFSITAYADSGKAEQIEFIKFETSLGLLYLNVDIDTDQLFWSEHKSGMHDDTELVAIKAPLSKNKFIVFMYWTMINNNGYYDALQLHTRVEEEQSINYSYIQFVGQASYISCYEFGAYNSSNQ